MKRIILLLILIGQNYGTIHMQVLNPPYFNIAEGRNITASATCGENVPEPELYCKIVGSNRLEETENFNLIEGQACDYCDPNDPKRSHPPQYAIDGTERWWQSPPLSRGAQYSKVNLTLNLGQEFNVAYVFIKMGNSPRPGVWILERSRDYGQTYYPWQYFADTPQDCSYFFGKHTLQPITRDDSVICETKFSKLVPLENGEIAISLINGRPSAENFSLSTVLQEWTTATNIRLRFLRPKTTLGHLLSVAREEPTVTRRYFYSIKDINIGGQCVCNGHASQCDQSSPQDPLKLSCACQHHTCGLQCEECCDGYQQYKWRRATIGDLFVCEKCNCHGHSNQCYFDEEISRKNLSKNIYGKYEGGGVCQNCQHNTTGINCDKCRDGFYRPKNRSLDAIDVCHQCECDLNFSTGNCFDETGQCECRKNFQPPDCDRCSVGYFGYPVCQECHCFPNGTIGNLCELREGESCPCKEGYGGKYCKECKPGYYGFPDCKPCDCNPNNSIDNVCDVETGQCKCQTNYGGQNCNKCNQGFFNYPRCESCLCQTEGSTEEKCNPITGECYCLDGYEKNYCDKCSDGYYGYPNCIKCDCNMDGSTNNSCDNNGKCRCKGNFGGIKCNDCAVGHFNFPKCEQCKCHWRGSTGVSCDHSGNCLCQDRYEGQKCEQCKEGYYNFPYCEECNCNPAGLVAEFGGCDKVEIGKLCECKERVKGRICNQCKDLYWNLQMNNPYGCEDCHCNQNGTISRIGICDTVTGDCMCKMNVQGRTCNMCKPNTYQLNSARFFGCMDCECDVGGAVSSDCDKLTGQCRCKSRIRGKTCSETFEATYFPTFYQFQYETEDWYNPTGSTARFGYDDEIFPDYSWRGYAIFSPLQKEIFTNITITKTSIYKIIINYVNKNSETINGNLRFIPNEWMNEEEQTVSISMEPTDQPKLLYVTGRQSNGGGMISLGVGPWQIYFQSDKYDLYIDYLVLIPQAYYDPNLFQEKRTGPCLYKPLNNHTCILHSYPDYPITSKHLPVNDALIIKESGQTKPSIVDYDQIGYLEKLNTKNQFARMDKMNDNLEFEFITKQNVTNLIILNYHTPDNLDQSISISIELTNLERNQTFTSENILSACPYLFVCRQAIITDQGKILSFDGMADDAFRLRIKLSPKQQSPSPSNYNGDRNRRQSTEEEVLPTESSKQFESLNVNTITIIPFDNHWSYDYIEPNFVCNYKNGKCQTSNFPLVSEGIKIEAETDLFGQKPEQIVEHPQYNQINPGITTTETPLLVRLNDSMQSIDIRGTVTKPGPYYFILNYYQPNNPKFDIDALIQNGHLYSGVATLQHCPNTVGCRVPLKQKDSMEWNSTAFSIQKNFQITLKIPTNENSPNISDVYLDYLLVIPAENFDEQLIESVPVDGHKNIMAECIKNNYFIDPKNTTEFCRSLVFSTTVDFNGGALPCECNIDGSYDYKCENFGGQCRCKPNVIGRDCSLCKTGYYGWPNCKQCNCPSTAICHRKTGDCICPKGVTGKDCDKCLPLTFGFDKIIGCVDCGCNPRGVQNRDLRCNVDTGDCQCRPNIVGRTCDKCRPGFFGFPNCQLCRCDIRGTVPEICDQNSARCFCKKNVDGQLCDRCKTDSYHLEESNSNGCTKCFCFGNTDRCTGSSMVFVPIQLISSEKIDLVNITMQENLLDINQLKINEDYEMDYVMEKFQIRTSFSREKLDNKLPSSSSMYLSLPDEFLGNKITSYGSEFHYNIINKVSNNNREYKPSSSMPDIIFVGKNYSLIYENIESPVLNEKFNVTIRLLEKEFKKLDETYVTREQLMMTLVDLQAIYIRIKYFDSTQDTIVIEFQFQMETSVTGSGRIIDPIFKRKATSVEQCLCPRNYRGTSCEECAEGYYRIQHGPYLGACVPCRCNGHSNTCDPITGQCFDCKFNTEGDYCEHCSEGYYGDATQGTPNDCMICACPLPIESNNFATSCEVSSSGSVLSCTCRDGYNGTRCELCGAGHWGQPHIVGEICQNCECNGNIDPTDIDSCDPFTGKCKKCLFNSGGNYCEHCADWYYGDSIVQKNCSECSCNKCGSEYCDHKMATCKCKPNVIGKNCDQCAVGYYGFQTCQGCQPCMCGEASNDINCDDSGQCPCKTGVAGKNCGTCAPGYWGYSKYGCTSCGCNDKYSRVKQCNQFTGQCQCLPGVIGSKCEKCPDRWVLVPETGCQECGDCVHTLLDDADQIGKDIEFIESQTLNTSSSVLAYRKLNSVQNQIKMFKDRIQNTFAETDERMNNIRNFTKVKNDSEDLLNQIEKMDIKSDGMEKNSIDILNKVNKAYNDSIAAGNKAKLVLQSAVEVVDSLQHLENNIADYTENQMNRDAILAESEQILLELQKPFVDDYMSRYDKDNNIFNDTLKIAENFYTVWLDMKNNIEDSSIRQHNISNLINELKNFTYQARSDTIDAEKIIQNGYREIIDNEIDTIKKQMSQTELTMQNATNFIEQTGKNINDLESMKIDIKQQENRLIDNEKQLEQKRNEITDSLMELDKVVTDAEKHAEKQSLQSDYLDQLISTTKNQATDPLKAANAYDKISNTVQDSEFILNDLKESIGKDNTFMDDLKHLQEINQEPTATKIDRQLNDLADQLRERESIINHADLLSQDNVKQFENLNQSLLNLETMLNDRINIDKIEKSTDNVQQTQSEVLNLINLIDNLKDGSKDIKDYSNFVMDVKDSKDYVDRFQKDVERMKNISTTDEINDLNREFAKVSSTISNKIADLKKRIQLARHQANNIRVGVRFGENSVLELNNPTNLVESSTYNKFSMKFKGDYPEGMLAYIGNPIDGSNDLVKRDTIDEMSIGKTKRKSINYDYMCLELRRGKVVLIWDLGAGNPTMIEDTQNIYDQKWHQIIVERFGRLIRLSVLTDKQRTESQQIAPGSASVFNLDRDQSKIFIGGVPTNIKLSPAVKNRHFYGVVSNVFLDNEPLGLWNVKNSYNIQGDEQANELFTENNVRFNGNSYIILARNDLNFKDTVFVSFQFKTFNKNGLLFLIGNPSTKKPYFSIELNDGKVVVKYDLGSIFTKVPSEKTYNDGQWHFIKVNREGKECLVTVDNSDEQSGFSMGLSTDLITDDNIYVGGYRGLNPYYEVTKEGFDGCIKDLQIDSTQQNLNNHKESFGITIGCSTFVRVASFIDSKAYVIFQDQQIEPIKNDADRNDMMIQITFKFRTLVKSGLILAMSNEQWDQFIHVYLADGMLILRTSNNQLLRTDLQYYNDNKWHFITINFNQRTLDMDVDDINSFSIDINNPMDLIRLKMIYIGGMPIERFDYLFSQFSGCIGDISINYKFLNFANSNNQMNVDFKKCPLSINEDEILVTNFKDQIIPEISSGGGGKSSSQLNIPNFENCLLPPIPKLESDSNPEEKRFGNSLWSRYEFPISNDVAKGLENESGFQLKFKTTKADGILFYITSQNNIDFIGLYFLNDKLHYSFDCGSGRAIAVLSTNYNDNQWHTVTFSRKGKIGLLRVDEETVEVSSTGSTSSLNVNSPIFVGGVPKELRSQIKSHLKSADKNDYNYAMSSFAGCIRDIKVRDQEYPFKDGRDHDVVQCSSEIENGHFFHYNGGYIRLFDEFRVSVEFTLIMKIKPRKPYGILAAVFGRVDYLVLYLDKGKLIFSVNNGADPIIASDYVKNGICDGEWHTIMAFKTKNLVMLTIDDQPTAISTGQPGISSTDTKDPLYIGGLPAKLKDEKLAQLNNVKDDYLGCLQIISINGMPQTLNNAKIEGEITLNSCPIH
ncbi:laminin subunit alpha [Dermatophagoides pteronyssinus]|uniref:laminin subunit alpha n=1 Tax=Dermatophagoides pteronyssinus TaxID=6956 RepID=UPI003F671F3B